MSDCQCRWRVLAHRLAHALALSTDDDAPLWVKETYRAYERLQKEASWVEGAWLPALSHGEMQVRDLHKRNGGASS